MLTELTCQAAGGTYQGDGESCALVDCPIELTPFVDALPRPAVAQPISGAPGAYATVTMTGQNYHRPASALGPGGPPPGTDIDIYAVACLESDPTCCAVSSTVTVSFVPSWNPSISATTAPSMLSLVQSEPTWVTTS